MNVNETTLAFRRPRPIPRAAQGIQGAHRADRDRIRTGVIARQLDAIAPGTVTVRTVPIQTDAGGTPRRATWVYLLTADGQPVGADQEQHRAARGWLRRMLPHADWSRPQRYDASTGVLRDDSPEMPEELHA